MSRESVSVSVTCPSTVPGESVGLAGSWNGWDLSKCVSLSTSAQTFPTWTGKLHLPHGEDRFEYKYVVLRGARIVRWEPTHRNRLASAPQSLHDVYGSAERFPTADNSLPKEAPRLQAVHMHPAPALDKLETALLELTQEQKSWRQRLAFVRHLFTNPPSYFVPTKLSHLATVAIYLSFLSTNQVPCAEDGAHYRPNHHANEAMQIERALSQILSTSSSGEGLYIAHVARKIFPHLPSYSSAFTVSVPLTRIRDIAHRGDIPHHLKQEIKHTLQNKLHRCAGPEDLVTCEKLLQRVGHGGYSEQFVHQLRLFHDELKQFFNAASLDDRLAYLQKFSHLQPHATQLAHMKINRESAMKQMRTLTNLRTNLLSTVLQDEQTPTEDIQKSRLADIALEDYAFMLLAGVAKNIEAQHASSFDWNTALTALAVTLNNIALSGVCRHELLPTCAELFAVSGSRDVLRIKAAVDRARRFAQQFSTAISDVYSQRVVSLGSALGVDQRAMQVFAEAEIRANLTFQASRIVDKCAKVCRRQLKLPPWDVLNAGIARGKVVFEEHLGDVRGEGDIVAVCKWAEGDEEVGRNVRGVVLGRAVPLLSHLGVRARQGGVVFVCAEEGQVFEEVWKQREMKFVEMVVDGMEGLREFREKKGGESKVEESRKDVDLKKNGKKVEISFDASAKKVLRMMRVTKGNGGSKSYFAGRLFEMAKKSDGLFEAPNGMCIPHGVFQEQVKKWKGEYAGLVNKYERATGQEEVEECAKSLYEFVQRRFELDDDKCKELAELKGKVMVRSSANAEDLEEMSGAGLYDSIANVNVRSKVEVKQAVGKVWASLWTKRAAASRSAYGVGHGRVSMGVLVQEMVEAELSFIAFSKDPVGGDDRLYVEVAVGMGETLASGTQEGSAYRFRIDRNTLRVECVALASFAEALVAAESGLDTTVVDYSEERMTTDEQFRTKIVRKIARVVLKVEQLGGLQDVEGVVVGDKVTVVQARPQIL